MEEALEIYSHQLHVTKGSDSEILSLLTKGLQQMIV